MMADSSSSPSALLRLVSEWANHPTLWPLLNKQSPEGLTPMQVCIDILSYGKCAARVEGRVMMMLQCILNPEFEQDQELAVSLVNQHSSSILKYVSRTMLKKKAKKNTIAGFDLQLLRGLSAHIHGGADGDLMMDILLHVMKMSDKLSAQDLTELLTAIKNMAPMVTQPTSHISAVLVLFSTMKSNRPLLCDLLHELSATAGLQLPLGSLAHRLNACVKAKWEEPDYQVRLEAVQECVSLAVEETFVSTLLLHQGLYVLTTHIDDLSLREAAFYSFSGLFKAVPDPQCPVFKDLIAGQLLLFVKRNIAFGPEKLRNDCITILSMLVKSYPASPLFCDMIVFVNDKDVEADIFQNLIHIQVGCRIRALLHISKLLPSLNLSTILTILLPLAKAFLRQQPDAKVKSTAMVDASINIIGRMARILPWPQYLILLRHCIRCVDKANDRHKVHIHCLCTVLDNFHFQVREDSSLPQKNDERNKNTSRGTTAINNQNDLPDDGDVQEDVMDVDGVVHESSMEVDGLLQDAVESCVELDQCSPDVISKITKALEGTILPQLQNMLTKKSTTEDEHKTAHLSREAVLRIPLALAVTRLLKVLQHDKSVSNVSWLVLYMCNLLRSRVQKVRDVARETLVKMSNLLGPVYLPYILKEMQDGLRKGYQLYVLGYTVFSILNSLSEGKKLTSGDLDSSVKSLCHIFNEEIFGKLASDKLAEGFKSTLTEAKHCKSKNSYSILVTYLSAASLPTVLNSITKILEHTKSHRIVRNVENVLRRIGLSLLCNPSLQPMDLAVLIYEQLNYSLEASKPKKPDHSEESNLLDIVLDSRLLMPEPGRGGPKAKVVGSTNLYVITSFSLEILYSCLKSSRLKSSDREHIALVDPFVDLIMQTLTSPYSQVQLCTVRCLVYLIHWPLPGFNRHSDKLVQQVFTLLDTGANNFLLSQLCYKLMTAMLRTEGYHISKEQVQVLLSYVDKEITNSNRQLLAFSLLKAILSRRVIVPELAEIVANIANLSIQSDLPAIRLQSRQLVVQYVLEFPLGPKKVQDWFNFYIAQLGYEHEGGRESALEFLATVFLQSPQPMLAKLAVVFFVPLASRLVNDDSVRCQKLAALAIKALLDRLTDQARMALFSLCVKWLSSTKKPTVSNLGAQTLALFVDVEGEKFSRHLEPLLELVKSMLDGYHQMEEQASEECDLVDVYGQINSVVQLYLKLLTSTTLFIESYTQVNNIIWDRVKSLLKHSHLTVALSCSQLYAQLFTMYTPQQLLCSKQVQHYLGDSPDTEVTWLAGRFYKLFSRQGLTEDDTQQVLKNLMYVAQVLMTLPTDDSLKWLIGRMAWAANLEGMRNPKVFIKRTAVFKWISEVTLQLGEKNILDYLDLLLTPLVREISKKSGKLVSDVAHQAIAVLKVTAGQDQVLNHITTLQEQIIDKRKLKKQDKHTQPSDDSALPILKKMQENLVKRQLRKRKRTEKNMERLLKRNKVE